MKKRILAALLMVVMLGMIMTGCQVNDTDESGGGDAGGAGATEESVGDTDTSDSTEDSDSGEMFVGITMPSVGNDFMLAMSEQMKAAVEETGCKVQLDVAENNVTKQIEQIENFTSMGCDIIVVWAVNGEGVASACEKAQSEGVKTVAFAYEIPGATSSIISASEEDLSASCVSMADEWINKEFPDAADGEVKVMVITSSTTPEAVIRSDGLLKIADNPKVTVISEEITDQDKAEEARTLAENVFQTQDDIDVVIAMNGTIGLGFDSFLNSSSSPLEDKSKFAIFCVDESEEIISKIKASANDESVLRGTISMGSMGDTIGDFMKGVGPLIEGKAPVDVKGTGKIITADTLE